LIAVAQMTNIRRKGWARTNRSPLVTRCRSGSVSGTAARAGSSGLRSSAAASAIAPKDPESQANGRNWVTPNSAPPIGGPIIVAARSRACVRAMASGSCSGGTSRRVAPRLAPT
jgi:hypothetical protein